MVTNSIEAENRQLEAHVVSVSKRMRTISGFMVVRDAMRQGYPFAEAIASALPICDEFLVSDGYSTDGTFQTLQRIASLNKKVRVYQDRWLHSRVTIIGDLSNLLRKKCKSDYLFSVQAPEIVHEDSVGTLKAIPEIFPEGETFCLPYTSVIADCKVQEEFRLRFCRNLDRLILAGDAWTFSTSKRFIRSEAVKSLAHPRRLMRYVGRGIDWTFAGYLNNVRSQAVCLPKPVFRYPALFKENYIERCKGHAERLGLPGFCDVLKRVENEQGESFFQTAVQVHREGNRVSYPGDLGVVKTESQPKIMQELVKNRTAIERYYVRETVLDAIAKA
jgi:hypothetical protein